MKYLTDYMDPARTQIFDKYGAFFAFSNKQLDEKRKEGVTYASMGMGLICPEEHAIALINALDEVLTSAINMDIAENEKEPIIRRELENHEYCITQDITDTVDALAGYDFTKEDIMNVARKIRRRL